MPSKSKYTYGNKVKGRIRELFKALLCYVNHECEENLDIEWKWEAEASNNLNIKTTVQGLVTLIGKDKYNKTAKAQTREALKHYLKEYLVILEDNRTQTKGSDEWIFTLKLWSRDKDTNLKKFDELWEEKRQGKSKDLASKEQKEENLWRKIFHQKLETQLEYVRHKATERGLKLTFMFLWV